MKLFENVLYTIDLTEEMVTFKLTVEYAFGATGILTPNTLDLRVGSAEFAEFDEAVFIRQPISFELRFKLHVWLNDTYMEKIPKYCLSIISQEAKSLRAELRNHAITKEIILTPLQKLFNIYAVK